MAPHCVEQIPAGVACNPRNAGAKKVVLAAKNVIAIQHSSTDNQPPTREEGEGVAHPWLWEVGDGAGVGGGAGEQLNISQGRHRVNQPANHHLP